MSEIFTTEDYIKILRNRFETPDIEFLKAERESFSDDIEGFMCEHFVLKITYKLNNDIKTERFFIKTIPKHSEYQKKINEDQSSFLKETYAYLTLFEDFRRYRFDVSFAPRCYYSKNLETLVFENMIDKSFRMFKESRFLDIDHIKEALKAIALFHANSIAFEERKSEELGRVFRLDESKPEWLKEIFFIRGDDDFITTKFVRSSQVVYRNLCRFVPESDEWKRKFCERLDGMDFMEMFGREIEGRKACGHADLWANNLLFKYEDGVPVKCVLVDFPLVRYYYPVYDALLVLYNVNLREFRKRHFEDLLKFYYEYFWEVLSRYGYDGRKIIPLDEFERTRRSLEVIALFQACCDRAVICLPKDIINGFNDEGCDVSLQDLIENDKTDLIMKVCESDEKMKKMFVDEIYDLNEHFERML